MRLDAKTMRTLQAVSGFGCSIAFCLVVSIAAGSWADQRMHTTKHWFVLIGIFVGLIGAAAITYNLAATLSDRKKDNGSDTPGKPDGEA